MRQAYRNYMKGFFPAIVAYVLVLFGSIYLLRWLGDGAALWLQILIAVSPALPIGFACRAYIRYVAECDEMERRIELESIALSAMIVSMTFMCLGFLAASNIVALDGSAVAIWVFPSLCGIYGFTKMFSSRRYQ